MTPEQIAARLTPAQKRALFVLPTKEPLPLTTSLASLHLAWRHEQGIREWRPSKLGLAVRALLEKEMGDD